MKTVTFSIFALFQLGRICQAQTNSSLQMTNYSNSEFFDYLLASRNYDKRENPEYNSTKIVEESILPPELYIIIYQRNMSSYRSRAAST